ncbi:hypothetical protein T03_1507 [Trichinella britovi]|uniref:Uncharacterized protein n=1 Tax=Trichinella britovi TaxID=45882 RepID=A0A0V0Z3S0_TRIBR|nr:hypothetical protein T03_1507 [Trichinella britovi]
MEFKTLFAYSCTNGGKLTTTEIYAHVKTRIGIF